MIPEEEELFEAEEAEEEDDEDDEDESEVFIEALPEAPSQSEALLSWPHSPTQPENPSDADPEPVEPTVPSPTEPKSDLNIPEPEPEPTTDHVPKDNGEPEEERRVTDAAPLVFRYDPDVACKYQATLLEELTRQDMNDMYSYLSYLPLTGSGAGTASGSALVPGRGKTATRRLHHLHNSNALGSPIPTSKLKFYSAKCTFTLSPDFLALPLKLIAFICCCAGVTEAHRAANCANVFPAEGAAVASAAAGVNVSGAVRHTSESSVTNHVALFVRVMSCVSATLWESRNV